MNSKIEIEELTKSQKIAKILYERIKRYLKAKESEDTKNSQKYFGDPIYESERNSNKKGKSEFRA